MNPSGSGVSRSTLLVLALALPALSGCVVSTVADVATAPVRAVGQGVDWATTSQSEADEKRGRALRKNEEAIGKVQRRYEKNLRECDKGRQSACLDARDDYAELQQLRTRTP
ncbi:hypothetical protein HT136_10740 [Novosphingobium profundi]|uniref:hypothetical protein n=1 Tax=Novosphingobium profundi TaxID=1774954 RepID=UPI001BDB193F|nr:hypothetical protein [Novosphingobium profundi]MBT0668842.1 hypothetical protein [Novosphingobium profundi]